MPEAYRARHGERAVWAVGELLQSVAATLAQGYGACTVEGELGSFNRAGSGHCYFLLKDAEGASAALRCAMFRRAALLLDFAPSEGQRVEVRGRLALYEPRGELQLIVEAMRPAGAGALYEQFLRLRARLEAEGLFDAARKRAWPVFPRRLGVVTSKDAAALRDVVSAMRRRAPHVELVVCPSPVQGAEAPAALVAAIASAAALPGLDGLIVCRGGGSIEDLWAFNDERVVRAIVACPLPVICGIGHATDLTLSDLAADVTAPTPTAAAELAAPATEDGLAALSGLHRRLSGRVAHLLDAQALRLDRAWLRLARPHDAVQRQSRGLSLLSLRLQQVLPMRMRTQHEALARAAERLQRAAAQRLAQDDRRLATAAARLGALDPAQVLQRGYAWLATDEGAPLTSVAQLSLGATVRAVLSDGEADAEIRALRPQARDDDDR